MQATINSTALRSNLFLLSTPSIDSHDLINKCLEQESAKKRICVLDIDFFREDNQHELPTNDHPDSLLKLSLRADGNLKSEVNNISFSFDCARKEYLVCDMHLIYIFERIFLEVIKDFDPELIVFILSSETATQMSKRGCIFSGDCRARLYFYPRL